MVKIGILLNVVFYNYFIFGYCRVGNVDMVDRLYVEMIGKGFKFNVVMFTVLMDGYFRKGEVEKVFNIFDEMVR